MEKVLPWLALKSVPGVGNLIFKRLIDRFETPPRVFDAGMEALTEVDGISRRLAAAICGFKVPAALRVELDQTRDRGYRILTQADSEYPFLLRQIPDPPPYLYIHGKLEPGASYIAVVGSRNATPYGISITRRMCRDFAARGITIVSGMARGIDTAAHEGALGYPGRTVAVLGSGLGKIYPAENQGLFAAIAQNGAVLSEFSLDTGPEAHHFPIRNRIISGMSLGTVIAEATKNSGSLITARLALEQNREVFAVPGSIRSFKSTGTHSLIKQGAQLVENANDVLEELGPLLAGSPESAPEGPKKAPPVALKPEEEKVFQALGPYPVHIDDLVRTMAMEPGRLSGILLQLELSGAVRQLPGKRFIIEDQIH